MATYCLWGLIEQQTILSRTFCQQKTRSKAGRRKASSDDRIWRVVSQRRLHSILKPNFEASHLLLSIHPVIIPPQARNRTSTIAVATCYHFHALPCARDKTSKQFLLLQSYFTPQLPADFSMLPLLSASILSTSAFQPIILDSNCMNVPRAETASARMTNQKNW